MGDCPIRSVRSYYRIPVRSRVPINRIVDVSRWKKRGSKVTELAPNDNPKARPVGYSGIREVPSCIEATVESGEKRMITKTVSA